MPCDRCGAAVVFVQPHSIAVSGFAAGCGGGLPFLPDCAAAAGAALQQSALPDWLPEAVQKEARTLSQRCAYSFASMRPEAVRALYGRTIPLSASKIDRFAGAGYAFSCNTAARRALEAGGIDAPLFGSSCTMYWSTSSARRRSRAASPP